METSRQSPARFSLQNVVVAAVPLALLTFLVIWFTYLRHENQEPAPLDMRTFLRTELLAPTQLDPSLGASTDELVAATPKELKDQIDPATLVFAVLELDDDKEQEVFADFARFLEKKTGKKVSIKVWEDTMDSQMEALRKGDLHLAALSTGSVSVGVNKGGIVPFCVMADDKGQSGYHAEIIVPANSPVKTPADLKGKTIGFVSSYSFSGFKAPIVLLWNEFKMMPGTDYRWTNQGSQRDVADGVAAGQLPAGAVASDLLQRRIAAQKIEPKAVRTIYKSEATYPPASYGYAHQLKPELVEKIKTAFLEFPIKGSSLESSFSGQTKFVPITYKQDWAAVRKAEQEALRLIEAEPVAAKK